MKLKQHIDTPRLLPAIMTTLEKKCQFSQNQFKFELQDNVATMESYQLDPHNIRLFFLLVNEVTEELKKKGCERVRMWCTKTDWDKYIKHTNWKLVEKETNQQNILSDIIFGGEHAILTEIETDKFPVELARGCGFDPLN